ncbi:TlpA family protein disulfide reductase [Leptospira sarikeiensis]|uniref:TlpA family protein disulfide reductase n=1 Tax=Leptospira sarikeiensis TaxID=2484943 RepID=A0A4R9KDG2_9LEPT|nr:redoxin domain-containing protein [Leptospira sarikeiensis]TGL63203.1 TlpA family protein disulfide reductase [Leptospira sarikeiensis]
MKITLWILLPILFVKGLSADPRELKEIQNIPLYSMEMERKTLYQELNRLSEDDLVILNFTSSDCPPCKEEVPNLLEYSKKWNVSHPNRKLYLWIIFIGDDPASVSKLAEEFGIKKQASLYFDSLQTSMRILGFPGTPTTIVVQKKKILFKEYGYTNENWTKLISVLETRR